MPEPKQSSPRQRPNLSNLFDSLEEKKVDSLRTLTGMKAASSRDTSPLAVKVPLRSGGGPRLASELQIYLPPDLWRKLSGDSPRSGIYLNALERLNSLLYTIATYLPANLVQEKMTRPIPGLVDGKILRGCLLFSDVSGFTALSERLAALGPEGAEHLTGFINRYFTAMIDIISWSNGTLLKFAGDATLIYFPEQENGDHARWAARAGLRMLRAMSDFKDIPTPLGTVSLSMKLGMAAGGFLAASIGAPKRMEYALIGETVAQTMQAEGNSSSGLLVMNRDAADILRGEYDLDEIKSGFFHLSPGHEAELDTFEIRPEKRRARSTIPWDASIEDLATEIHTSLTKIQSLAPYLASELLDRIVSHASQRRVSSEYRPTVVMFCNFSGPEALLETWGSDGTQRVTGLLSAYFSDMNEAISRFGGIVSRIDPYSKGTKLLALFGAPVAHEDDPQRAVSAALAMNTALQALNRRWAQKLVRHLPPGFSQNLIQHRIGITLGETFAGQAGSSTRREYTVMGDEVNLAARLMSVAEPGQILVSEKVLERVNTYYVSRKLPPVRVKGKKKPIPIFQIDGPREDTLLSRIHTRPALVGRAGELARAAEIFERARNGQGGLLYLTGPAGIGKSHLADTLARQALVNAWQMETFQCRSYQSEQPNACWAGLARALANISPLDHPLIQAEKLERLTKELSLDPADHTALTDLLDLRQAQLDKRDKTLTGGDDLLRIIKRGRTSRKASSLDVFEQLDDIEAASPSDTTPLPDRQTARQQSALAALLGGLSKSAPLLVFFEDIHWMDEASRQTLLELSRSLANRPVLFLLAGRPHVGLPEGLPSLELAPFSREETSAMAAAILTEGLTDIIHEQSNGSPLFVEEISRWIKRTQGIDEAGLKSILQASDILQKLVLSTLESLPETQREIARLASVVGVEFRRSDVEALLQDSLDPVSLTGYLRSLSQSRLIELNEAGIDPRYTFEQTIFREILYTSLPFERRRELHALMAEHIKNRSSRRQLRDKIGAFLDDESKSKPQRSTAETLAHHYEMSEQWLEAAQQLNTAAGLVPPEQGGSEPLFNRSLAILERIPAQADSNPVVGLQKALADTGLAGLSLRADDLPAAAASCEAALAAAPLESLPPELAARLTVTLALAWPSQGKTAKAAKQLNAFLEKHADDENAWKFHALQAWLTWRAGDDPAGLAASARESLPETANDSQVRARALLDDLSAQWPAAIPLYKVLNHTDCACLALIRLGDSHLRAEEFDESGKQYELARADWKKSANPPGLALCAYRRAELAWLARADAQASLSLLEESLEWLAKSPPALQTGPRALVQNALARIKKRQPGPWEAWHWEPFEDLVYIGLLLPIF
ncbi:MAG: adenylate/guanylate cyclase domain-containing protein [Anaerolineales bacterium]